MVDCHGSWCLNGVFSAFFWWGNLLQQPLKQSLFYTHAIAAFHWSLDRWSLIPPEAADVTTILQCTTTKEKPRRPTQKQHRSSWWKIQFHWGRSIVGTTSCWSFQKKKLMPMPVPLRPTWCPSRAASRFSWRSVLSCWWTQIFWSIFQITRVIKRRYSHNGFQYILDRLRGDPPLFRLGDPHSPSLANWELGRLVLIVSVFWGVRLCGPIYQVMR